ncbi:MAG: caspase family protein [Chloroflexi bacterium]|nr:caspase family protein [Chloroflexota bacterium]
MNSQSWALLIGIDRYKGNHLPPLETAERGTRALADVLEQRLGFPRKQIVTLINQEATRDVISAMLTDYFTDPRTISDNAKLLVYYAGHGLTRNAHQANGDTVGYLAPFDTESGRWSTFIEMNLLERQAGFMPARHVLFMLDACFSGLAMTRSTFKSIDPLQDLLNRPSRRVITAGSSDQPTSDRLGQEQHSAFTHFLLEGLQGAATRDGILRAAHLGIFIQDQVRKHTVGRQTPQIGKLLGDRGGDFVFHIEAHAKLEAWLQNALVSASPQERLKAAYELWETVEANEDPEMVQFALQTMQGMQYDHDTFVRSAVREVLKKINSGQETPPPIKLWEAETKVHRRPHEEDPAEAETAPFCDSELKRLAFQQRLEEHQAETLVKPPKGFEERRKQKGKLGR